MPETILAFDYGLRRIGVAVGQDVTGSASPVGTVSNGENGVDHDRIKARVAEWHPTTLVVGRISKQDIDAAAAVCIAERYLAGR